MTDPTGTVQTQEVTYENINTDAPNELDRPFTVRHEELSCNFYWTSKAGYSLQTTIRGNPTTAEIHAHLEAVVETVRAVIKLGGSPKGGQAQASPAPMKTIRCLVTGSPVIRSAAKMPPSVTEAVP